MRTHTFRSQLVLMRSQHRRADEEVEGESHREVLRVGKGKEGFVRDR